MRKNNFNEIVYIFLSVLVLLVSVFLLFKFKNANTMNHNRVEYLRDSLQMEYYKKQLETYPFEHSKIPTEDGTK